MLCRSTTARLNGLLPGALHVRASTSSSMNISFMRIEQCKHTAGTL